MRNLQQYPITTKEIVECLQDIIDEKSKAAENGEYPIGNMDILLLNEAKRIIAASSAALVNVEDPNQL